MQFVSDLFQSVASYFKGLSVTTTYIQAGAIIILIFLLVVSLAKFRHYAVKGSFKGGFIGLLLGFLLALFLEGFLLVAGRTAVTELLGWKEAPKPIMTALDLGHEKLVNVLGESREVPSSFVNSESSIDGAISSLQSLNPDEIKKLKTILCEP